MATNFSLATALALMASSETSSMLNWVASIILLEAQLWLNIVADYKTRPNAWILRFFLDYGNGEMIAVSTTDACNKIVGGIEDDEAIK